MKILYLSPGVFDKGGISRYTRFQIQALQEIVGKESITIMSLLGPKGSRNDLESEFHTDYHGNSKRKLFSEILRYSYMAAYFTVKKKPDIIWSGILNNSALAVSLAKLTRATSIVQVYGNEVWTPRPCRPDIPWGLAHCDYVLSDCYFSAEYIKKHNLARKDIPVFWDCVDINRFYPREPSTEILKRYNLPDPKEHFNIMTLGRLSTDCTYKGYERLLSLFPKLDKQVTLIFGGGGDLIPKLKQQALELGVSDRVFFTDFINDADLPDLYRAASVFCLVGDRGLGRGEGIPLTPLEAAACGIPILVGNQDGSSEAVEQGINGYALDPFNLDEIVNHLNELANDRTHSVALGIAARKRIEKEHSYIVFKDHIQEFIQNLEKR